MFKILLYYKYILIKNPQDFQKKQLNLCKLLNLKGRIIIASEGINGTIEGTLENIDKYINLTQKRLGSIEWKVSYNSKSIFPKTRVVLRDEIVTLGLKKTFQDISLDLKAEYIEPQALYEKFKNNEDFYIIDARNDYETKIGKFKNTIDLNFKNFREFPEVAKKINYLKDKQIITVCTGGVRCEKASAYLKSQGFSNIKQLHGGIIKYGEVTGGKDFLGTCYVFDERIHIEVNKVNSQIITQCEHCHKYIARYLNCCNAKCNKQFICCENCEMLYQAGCSKDCQRKSRFVNIKSIN